MLVSMIISISHSCFLNPETPVISFEYYFNNQELVGDLIISFSVSQTR